MTDNTKETDVDLLIEKVLGSDNRGAIGLSVHEIKTLAHAVREGQHCFAILEDAAQAHAACSALIATTMWTLKSVEGKPSDGLLVASQGLSKLNEAFDRFRNLRGAINE